MKKRTTGDPLLAECEPYFLDGVHTIAEFARRTQDVVWEAVDRHWGPLLKALGFSEKEVARSDYCWPDKLQKATPTDAISLGARLKASDLLDMAIYRYWVVEEKQTGIEAHIWIKGREKLDRLGTAINDLPDPFPPPEDSWDSGPWSSGTYFIQRVLAKPEIAQLDSRLDELVSYFIHLLTKAGGARKFLK
jgi:hypothetical protein